MNELGKIKAFFIIAGTAIWARLGSYLQSHGLCCCYLIWSTTHRESLPQNTAIQQTRNGQKPHSAQRNPEKGVHACPCCDWLLYRLAYQVIYCKCRMAEYGKETFRFLFWQRRISFRNLKENFNIYFYKKFEK